MTNCGNVMRIFMIYIGHLLLFW